MDWTFSFVYQISPKNEIKNEVILEGFTCISHHKLEILLKKDY